MNDLMIPEGLDLGDASTIKEVEAIAQSSGFLPRLALLNDSSKAAKGPNALPAGIFVLSKGKDSNQNLGKEVVFMALTMRPKALVMPDNGNPISYYDKDSEDFKRVQTKAEEGGMNGNIFGPEFLVWLPDQEAFATLHCSSATSRRSAHDIIQLMRRPDGTPGFGNVRLQSKFIETKKFSWWGFNVFANQSSLGEPSDPEEWKKQVIEHVTKFRNPPKSEVEVDEASANGRAR